MKIFINLFAATVLGFTGFCEFTFACQRIAGNSPEAFDAPSINLVEETRKVDISSRLTYDDLNISSTTVIVLIEGNEINLRNYLKMNLITELYYTIAFMDEKDYQWKQIHIAIGDYYAPVIHLDLEKRTFTEGEAVDVIQGSSITDNVDQHITLESDYTALKIGDNIVNYRAVDNAGNTAYAQAVFTLMANPVTLSEVYQPLQVSFEDSVTVYQESSIYFPSLAKTVSYRNGGYSDGQAIIDNNPALASTWGGTQVYSGRDNQSTHFIAHYYRAFKGIWKLGTGSLIIVTDGEGISYTYKVNAKYHVERLNPTAEEYNRITSTSGGERIVLQTCTDSTGKMLWIIEAELTEGH